MRIIMSTSDFLPEVGGLASVVWELSKALASRGHEMHIVHWQLNGRETYKDDVMEGIPIHRPVIQVRPNPWRRISWILQVSSILRRLFGERIDGVIHSHTFYPDGIAARLMPRPALRIFTNHTSGFLTGFENFFRRQELGFLLRGFDGVLSPSDELNEKTKACGVKQSLFISNGVDVSKFTDGGLPKQECRQRLNLPLDAKIILVARRFQRKNGVRYVAEAYDEIRRAAPDSFLVFCGPDCDELELRTCRDLLADQDPSRIRFAGKVPNDIMPLYFRAADVSVLPSLLEATSVAGLESMACGVPVVGTRVGGIPQIVQHGRTGLLVEPADSSALAAAIINILLNDQTRNLMSDASRRHVCSNFSWDRIAEKTEHAYVQLAAATRQVAL